MKWQQGGAGSVHRSASETCFVGRYRTWGNKVADVLLHAPGWIFTFRFRRFGDRDTADFEPCRSIERMRLSTFSLDLMWPRNNAT